jgi:hypothetical protein
MRNKVRSARPLDGIYFLTDTRGRKVAVQIDLERHGALWENIYDTLIMDQRVHEDRESWPEVKKQMSRRRSEG